MRRKIISLKEKKLILENFISLSTLQSINCILPIIVIPYLIRVIGAEKFGLIAFAQAFVQYFMILTDYGFSLSATRKISLFKEQKKKVWQIFSAVMSVKLILAAAGFLVVLLIVRFVPRFTKDGLVYILSYGAVIGNTLFPIWFLQGHEKMKHIATINITGGVIFTLSLFLFVRGPADFLRIPVLYSLFYLGTGVYGLYAVFTKFKIKFIFQTYEEIRQEFKVSWDVFISIVAINAYTTTRVFAVGLLTNNVITGYYSVAERLANFIQTYPLESFSQAIYPRLSKIFVKCKEKARILMNTIQNNTIIAYLIALPIVFVSTPWITKVFCGKPYKEVIISMRLLLVAVFFIIANAFRAQYFLVCGRADIFSKIHVRTAAVGLPLIFILTYFFSYQGTAFSTIIIEAGIFVWTLQAIKKLT